MLGTTVIPKWTILCNKTDLDLFKTLYSGQTFRWIYDNGVHKCILPLGPKPTHHIILLQQLDSHIYYTSIPPIEKHQLEHYFSLDLDMPSLYQTWSRDAYFKSVVPQNHQFGFDGLRMVRCDVVEVVMSFLCSQNNNLKRITGMVHTLCRLFGKPVSELINVPSIPSNDGLESKESTVFNGVDKNNDLKESESVEDGIDKSNDSKDTIDWRTLSVTEIVQRCSSLYTFPEWEDLTGDLDSLLRSNGFGYRASYFLKSRDLLMKLEYPCTRSYLLHIQSLSTEESREALLELPGVGRKVADCILLFGLGKWDVVPTDTHVNNIVSKHYSSFLTTKGVSKKKAGVNHDAIQKGFEKVFGEYSGIAHSVLFSDSLKNRDVNLGDRWVPWTGL